MLVAAELASGALVQPVDLAIDGLTFYAAFLPDTPRREVIEAVVTAICAQYDSRTSPGFRAGPNRSGQAMTDPEFLAEINRTIGVYEAFSGHAAARTRQMIDRHGAVEALARLTASAELQQGFKVLRDHGRLDDSFEALVVRFAHLFRPDAVEAAKWRLQNADKLL